MRLRLHRTKNQFCLMCSETNPNFKVKVLDAVLKVRKVSNQIIKSYYISAGSMSRSVDHVFRGVIPQRVVV